SLGRDVLRRTLDEGVDKIFRNQRDVAVFGLAPALGDLRSRHHSMESPRRGYGPPDLLRSGLLTRVRESADCLVGHPVGSDVIGVPIAAVGPIGDELVRAL